MRALSPVGLLAMGAAIGACGGDDGSAERAARGHTMEHTLPAEIDPHPQRFSSAEVLHPVTNAWRTSSHRRFTQVEAGALASDSSIGAFTILRHEFVSARQRATVVKVIGSGPLRITHAPLGHGVEASAQRDGAIDFVGAAGVRGTLHLRHDTVSLFPPRS